MPEAPCRFLVERLSEQAVTPWYFDGNHESKGRGRLPLTNNANIYAMCAAAGRQRPLARAPPIVATALATHQLEPQSCHEAKTTGQAAQTHQAWGVPADLTQVQGGGPRGRQRRRPGRPEAKGDFPCTGEGGAGRPLVYINCAGGCK